MKKFSVVDEKSVGDILRIYRKSNRMTQQKVADYLRVSRSAYAKYETMRTPEISVIIKLCKLYNTSLDDFFRPFFEENSAVSVAKSPDKSEEMQSVTKAEKLLLEYYRGSIRKAEILRAAEEIFNADIEIVNDVKVD
ncbi:MAG: helix-turn-helix domain-containing protein [Clostridia bacterium]|nr:helix-turn-helix domain-containing protein [Clostridia bacterium]MBR3818232.1 helix-turn-helix domain-containing protein [Clostridia bacterium]